MTNSEVKNNVLAFLDVLAIIAQLSDNDKNMLAEYIKVFADENTGLSEVLQAESDICAVCNIDYAKMARFLETSRRAYYIEEPLIEPLCNSVENYFDAETDQDDKDMILNTLMDLLYPKNI